MSAALFIDFGSTYTKLRALDLDGLRVLTSGQGPSTVTTDVTVGLDAALTDLERKLGSLPTFKYRLASSSAAGGLRMITIGEIYSLKEAQIIIEGWRRHFNTVRPHASFGYRPPAPEVFVPGLAAWPSARLEGAPTSTLCLMQMPTMN